MRVGGLGRDFGRMGGALGGVSGSAAFVPDTTPSAYRTTTQTMVAGRLPNCALDWIPQLSSEFSQSIWFRPQLAGEAYVWNFFDLTASVGAVSLGGGSLQAMALYFSGSTLATVSDQNKLYLTGTDKDGNHISASTTTQISYGNAYGYQSTETLVNSSGFSILLTVQYRNGNIELWATYRGMVPRLLIQQACTWNGTSGPLPIYWGGSNTTISSTGVIELEMPICIPDRSLSVNEIAQLADGISPEALNASAAKATGQIKFALVTDGTTTAADRAAGRCPAEGNTITLNGAVYTFRTSPSLANEVLTLTDYIGNLAYDATTNIFTTSTAHNFSNDQWISIDKTTMPGGIDAWRRYALINCTATTFQVANSIGGAAIDITTTASAAAATVSRAATVLDNLATVLNALTPNAGGASNATYVAAGAYNLFVTHRTAGGTSFTLDCNATNVKFPTNKRLALGQATVIDYTGFRAPILGSSGAIRRRSQAWVPPPGTELAPNTQVTGSLRVTSWQDGTVNNSVSGTSKLKLTGIYTGNAPASGGQLKLYDLADQSQVHDFTSLSSFTYDAGTKAWSGLIDEPANVNRWLGYQHRKTNSTQVTQISEPRIGNGLVFITNGRSHETDLFNTQVTNDVVPNGFCSQYIGANASGSVVGAFSPDNSWHRYDTAAHAGAGAAQFTNSVSAANTCPVALVSFAVGGAAFATLFSSTTAGYYNAALATTQGDIARMPLAHSLHVNHEGEDWTTLFTPLVTWADLIDTRMKIGLEVACTAKNSPDGTRLTDAIRKEFITYLNSVAGNPRFVDLGDYQYQYNTADGIHSADIRDTKNKGGIRAIAANYSLGASTYSAVGPTIASVTRSGAVIDITWNLNGATTLQVANAGADVSGFDVCKSSVNFQTAGRLVSFSSATDIFTDAGHPFSNGDILNVVAVTTQPGNIPAGTDVFVVNSIAGVSYQVSLTLGGAAINGSSNGAGVYVYTTRDYLAKTSVTIPSASVTRITLAANPGTQCLIHHRFGRPGKQNAATGAATIDPNFNSSPNGETALTDLWTNAQANPLCDNFAIPYATPLLLGRLARETVTPVLTPN